jgi:hypothetical protein
VVLDSSQMKSWLLNSLLFLSALLLGIGATSLWAGPAEHGLVGAGLQQQIEANVDHVSKESEIIQVTWPDELFFDEPTRSLIDVLEYDGIYRESEVIAMSGETWLGLFEQNGESRLVPVKASVRKLKTASFPGDEVDVKLSFNSSSLPYIAIRKIENVKPGPVTTTYRRPLREEIERRNLPIDPMELGYSRDFNLNDSWYTLRVSKGVNNQREPVSVLVLEHEGKSQIVTINYENVIGNLLWIGDLDADGKIDLYIDRFNEKGFNGVELYLSSHATEGQFVKLTATFSTAGC